MRAFLFLEKEIMKFHQLVAVVNGEPLASTEVIAKGMKQQHASVIKLVRKNVKALSVFGRVGFEIQPFATRGGQQRREIAMLNERQAALLISLMRNTEEVLDFKVALIGEFYRMRDALQQRDLNLWQQMQALIAQEVESKVRASFGSHLMLERKRKKKHFEKERIRLEIELQPSLLLN